MSEGFIAEYGMAVTPILGLVCGAGKGFMDANGVALPSHALDAIVLAGPTAFGAAAGYYGVDRCVEEALLGAGVGAASTAICYGIGYGLGYVASKVF